MMRDWLDQSDLPGYKLDYFYVMTGCFFEYFGGYGGTGAEIESFFPHEKELARIFQSICRRYLETIGCPDDTELEVAAEGHSTLFSEMIGAQLDAFYDRDAAVWVHRARQASGFETWNPEKKFSYLVGIYLRWFSNNHFKFANSITQAERTHSLLCEGSDEEDCVTMESHFRTPSSTWIKLNTDHKLLAELEKRTQQIKAGLLP
jgi:hypothetical protein